MLRPVQGQRRRTEEARIKTLGEPVTLDATATQIDEARTMLRAASKDQSQVIFQKIWPIGAPAETMLMSIEPNNEVKYIALNSARKDQTSTSTSAAAATSAAANSAEELPVMVGDSGSGGTRGAVPLNSGRESYGRRAQRR